MFRVILELFRIIAIIFILGSLLGALVKLIYASMEINVDNTTGGWFVGIAILILLFVFYRNRLQFSGFYNGEGNNKLSKKLSVSLISFSIFMIIVAPLFR
jgi:small-conductance mechanosensitive channel